MAELRPKAAGHDVRKCKWKERDEAAVAALPENTGHNDRMSAMIFRCTNPDKAGPTSMILCKVCRENNDGYEPAPDSPDYTGPARSH